MKKKIIQFLITIVLATSMQIAFAGTTHTEGGTVNNAADGTAAATSTFKAYNAARPTEISAGTVGATVANAWIADVGFDLTTQWAVGDYHICIIDKETNTGAANHKGYYAVTAKAITSSDPDTFNAVTLSPIPIPVATAGSAQVTLAWTAATSGGQASDISGYDVYRSTSQTSGFTKLNTNPVTTTNYTDSTVTAGTTYYYVLKLVYNATSGTKPTSTNFSANSNAVIPNPAGNAPTVTNINPNTGANNTTTNTTITGTNFTGATSVKIGAANVQSFTVNSATQISAVIQTGLAAATYDITVTTPNGTSAVIAADQFTATTGVNPPSGTVVLSGTNESTTSIRWSWTYSVADQTGFRLQDTSDNNKALTPANITATSEGNLTPNTAYTRHVRAFNGAGTGNASNNVTVWTLASAPTNLATTGATGSSISLTWEAGPGGSSSYIVYRAPDNGGVPGTFTQVGAPTSPNFTDSGLNPLTKYWYKINPVNGEGVVSTGTAPISGTTTNDSTPPIISNVLFDNKSVLDGDIISNNATINATITDESAVDPASVKVSINTTQFATPDVAYDPATKQMTFKINPALADAVYTVTINAKDMAGNSAVPYTIRIKVTGSDGQGLDGDAFNYPNPFNPYGGEKTKIAFNLKKNGPITIYIVDMAARVVLNRNLQLTAGYNEVIWDGINDYGELSANGVYPARIVAKDEGKIIGKLKIWVVNK